MVIVINYVQDLPLFGLLYTIVIPQAINRTVGFILSGFDTKGFNNHLYCYEVTRTMQWFYVEYPHILSFYSSSCKIRSDGNLYIFTFRHIL